MTSLLTLANLKEVLTAILISDAEPVTETVVWFTLASSSLTTASETSSSTRTFNDAEKCLREVNNLSFAKEANSK